VKEEERTKVRYVNVIYVGKGGSRNTPRGGGEYAKREFPRDIVGLAGRKKHLRRGLLSWIRKENWKVWLQETKIGYVPAVGQG